MGSDAWGMIGLRDTHFNRNVVLHNTQGCRVYLSAYLQLLDQTWSAQGVNQSEYYTIPIDSFP
jgi:hypothetical protein